MQEIIKNNLKLIQGELQILDGRIESLLQLLSGNGDGVDRDFALCVHNTLNDAQDLRLRCIEALINIRYGGDC